MKVMSYQVELGKPVKIVLQTNDGNVGFISSHPHVYTDDNTLRQFFPNREIPRKYIDIVERDEASTSPTTFKLKIVSRGDVSNLDEFEKYGHVISEEEFSMFFKDMGKIHQILSIYNTKGIHNDAMLTHPTKMTERDFVLQFITPKGHGWLKQRVTDKFLYYSKKIGLYPKEERYYNLYFESCGNFESNTGTAAIKDVIYKKMFKYVVEELCPYITVSLTREEHLHNIALQVSLTDPKQLKLDFDPFMEEICYSHTIDHNNARIRTQEGVGQCVSDKLSLFCSSKETTDDLKKKKNNKKKQQIRYTAHPIKRPLVILKVNREPRYYMCFDLTRAIVICHGSSVSQMLSDMNYTPIYFYNCEKEYRRFRREMRRKKKHVFRMVCKPPGYNVMMKAGKMYARDNILGDIKNAVWYKKGNVVFESEKNYKDKHGSVTCFDFSNYYATVLNVNNLDRRGIGRCVTLLGKFRTCNVSSVKIDIVCLLGLSKHYDERLYNLMKTASVTNMLETIIKNNPAKVLTVTTDGITFKGNIDDISLPNKDYTIKKEYTFDRNSYFFANSNLYFGFNKLNNNSLICKGIVGKNKVPVIKKFIETVIRCVHNGVMKGDKLMNELKPLLIPTVEDYTIKSRPNGKKTFFSGDLAYQELCQDMYVCYANMVSCESNANIVMDSIHRHKNPEIVAEFFDKNSHCRGMIHTLRNTQRKLRIS
ncbi:Hypothetical predicted protein [Mytilus galloprovincialis]|uniref:Uncharacterized protein n=1 Tax=Mytilus galloprovincialis TaxID=29158 RepID=A0A8B6E025_MYTGA|nr:Hypothetical predicted protein [Mytilus galloprovincialis]